MFLVFINICYHLELFWISVRQVHIKQSLQLLLFLILSNLIEYCVSNFNIYSIYISVSFIYWSKGNSIVWNEALDTVKHVGRWTYNSAFSLLLFHSYYTYLLVYFLVPVRGFNRKMPPCGPSSRIYRQFPSGCYWQHIRDLPVCLSQFFFVWYACEIISEKILFVVAFLFSLLLYCHIVLIRRAKPSQCIVVISAHFQLCFSLPFLPCIVHISSLTDSLLCFPVGI